MPPRSSAAPSLAPLALSASLAASGGAPLASAHPILSPSYLRDPRLAPHSSAFLSFAGWSSAGLQSQLLNLVSLSLVLYIIKVPAAPFVDRWASAGPTYGCRAAAGPSALPQASAGPHATPLALLLLRIHPLALGFLLRLRSIVRCRSLCGPQPVALRSLSFRRSDLLPFLIVFPPDFRLSTPGCMFGLRLYIAVRRLYRLFCPSEGGRCAVDDAPLPRRPVSHAVSYSGSGPLDTLGFSAVWFCPGMRSPCGVLYTWQRELV